MRKVIAIVLGLLAVIACVSTYAPGDASPETASPEGGMRGDGPTLAASPNYAQPIGPAGGTHVLSGTYPDPTLFDGGITGIGPLNTCIGVIDGGPGNPIVTWTSCGGEGGTVAAFSAGGDLYGTSSAQYVNSITPDGGTASWPVVNAAGFRAWNGAPSFGLEYGQEAGVSAIPGSINFWAQRPNVAASTPDAATPGSINENLYHPTDGGSWPGWNVVAVDDQNGAGSELLWSMGQTTAAPTSADGGLSTPASSYLWGPVMPGTPLTGLNYSFYCSKSPNTCGIGANDYVTISLDTNNGVSGQAWYRGGTGAPGAITTHGGTVFGQSAAVFGPQTVTPVYGILPQISNAPTVPVSMIGQTAYSAATGANQTAGSVPICGGAAVGSGATGVVTLGAGWVQSGGYPTCNITTTIDGQGILFPATGGTPSCVAGNGRIGSDASGNMWGCDSSGSAYRLAASGGSGITTLTNDVLAGPGSGSQPATVVQLTGSGGSVNLIATTLNYAGSGTETLSSAGNVLVESTNGSAVFESDSNHQVTLRGGTAEVVATVGATTIIGTTDLLLDSFATGEFTAVNNLTFTSTGGSATLNGAGGMTVESGTNSFFLSSSGSLWNQAAGNVLVQATAGQMALQSTGTASFSSVSGGVQIGAANGQTVILSVNHTSQFVIDNTGKPNWANPTTAAYPIGTSPTGVVYIQIAGVSHSIPYF